MGWFRSNRGKVTWLALFALTCQLVLSFGHIHVGKIGVAGAPMTANAAIAVNSGEDSAGLPPAPLQAPQKKRFGFGDDYCALCASINLANSLVVPSAPTVAPPHSPQRAATWNYAGLESAAFRHLFFDARGPPQV